MHKWQIKQHVHPVKSIEASLLLMWLNHHKTHITHWLLAHLTQHVAQSCLHTIDSKACACFWLLSISANRLTASQIRSIIPSSWDWGSCSCWCNLWSVCVCVCEYMWCVCECVFIYFGLTDVYHIHFVVARRRLGGFVCSPISSSVDYASAMICSNSKYTKRYYLTLYTLFDQVCGL